MGFTESKGLYRCFKIYYSRRSSTIGSFPCAANGANEAAVAHFLRDEIGFLDIGRLVEGIVDSDSFGGDYTLADVHECDRMARAYVEAHI